MSTHRAVAKEYKRTESETLTKKIIFTLSRAQRPFPCTLYGASAVSVNAPTCREMLSEHTLALHTPRTFCRSEQECNTDRFCAFSRRRMGKTGRCPSRLVLEYITSPKVLRVESIRLISESSPSVIWKRLHVLQTLIYSLTTRTRYRNKHIDKLGRDIKRTRKKSATSPSLSLCLRV